MVHMIGVLVGILLLFVSLPFLATGLIAVVWFIAGFWRDLTSRRWLRTRGRIGASRVVSNWKNSGLPGWYWKVSYTYVIPDEIELPQMPSESDSVDLAESGLPVDEDATERDDEPTDPETQTAIDAIAQDRNVARHETPRFRYRSLRAATRIIERYPVGAEVEVAFDPKDPRFSSTIRPGLCADLLYPAIVGVVGLGLAAWLIRSAFAWVWG